jgi:hypothetical protein
MNRLRIACTILTLALFASTRLSAQSETTYDVEFSTICLVDSIAPDTINQIWLLTHANNPGEFRRYFAFDFSSSYTPAGTLISCSDYYLGDNVEGSGTAGTLPIWATSSTLGNSSLSEASGVISSSLTGALKLPAGTDAQDPVWSGGMLRYNTTTGGFQGYNTAERYLPWADASSFTNTRIPFSDGNQLTTSANLIFSANELRIGGAGDFGNYPLQISGAVYANGLSGSFVATGGNNMAGTGFNFTGTGTALGASSLNSDTNAGINLSQAGSFRVIRSAKTNSSGENVKIEAAWSNQNIGDAQLKVTRGTSMAPNLGRTMDIIEYGHESGNTGGGAFATGDSTYIGIASIMKDSTDAKIKSSAIRTGVLSKVGNSVYTELSFWNLENSVLTKFLNVKRGSVGIYIENPNQSAALDVNSTTQGFLPPRMTTAQRDAIASPAAGLLIFNTTTTKLECWDGATWQAAW